LAHADLIVGHGRVFTVSESQPWTEAVAVREGRILMVGSDDEVDVVKGPDTKVIDAGGRLVLPGFIDAHTHCLSAYQVYFWADLVPVSSQEEMIRVVARHASEHPDHRLVGGTGFRYAAISKDGRLPGRSVLDGIVSDRPAYLVSYDGWTACTNSRFVEAVRRSLGPRFGDLPGVERDPGTGEPTGVFYRTEELENIVDEAARAGTDLDYEGLRRVLDDMARWGITSVHDMGARSLDDIGVYDRLRREGRLKSRAYVAIQYRREKGAGQMREFVQARSRYNDEWIRGGAVKLFIDGVSDSHTAALLEPYSDDPQAPRDTFYPPEEFKSIVAELDKLGLHCITHSCGDKGVRVVLDAYEHATRSNGPRDSRHRIEHVELVSDEDIQRFRPLGVIPSMQPTHAHLSTPEFDEVYGKIIGHERLEGSFPWRGLMESGATLAFSSDWPVADMNPFLGIHTAITRGGLVGRHNTIGLEDAIRAYTIGAAYASHEEKSKGSLEPGKLADLVVVSKNLFEIPVERIKDVTVSLTILGGQVVYRSDTFTG